MTELLDRLTLLLNQLLDIGNDHVELLIACLVIIAAIGVTVTLFCICVILSIPFFTVYGLVKLIIWLYYLRHPEKRYDYWDDEESDELDVPELKSEELKDLPPVYPDWMNKKSGRLL